MLICGSAAADPQKRSNVLPTSAATASVFAPLASVELSALEAMGSCKAESLFPRLPHPPNHDNTTIPPPSHGAGVQPPQCRELRSRSCDCTPLPYCQTQFRLPPPRPQIPASPPTTTLCCGRPRRIAPPTQTLRRCRRRLFRNTSVRGRIQFPAPSLPTRISVTPKHCSMRTERGAPAHDPYLLPIRTYARRRGSLAAPPSCAAAHGNTFPPGRGQRPLCCASPIPYIPNRTAGGRPA